MSVRVHLGGGNYADLEPDRFQVDRELLEPLTGEAAARPAKPLASSGRHDSQARRRAQRRGRERGCWVYISADALGKAGFEPDEPPPWYRVWGGKRARYVVTLYREP